MEKIKIDEKFPLVILHGDEMADVAFRCVISGIINKYLDVKLQEIDLSAGSRVVSNGKIIDEAISALLKARVGVKNAGVTPNEGQTQTLLAEFNENFAKLSKEDKLRLISNFKDGVKERYHQTKDSSNKASQVTSIFNFNILKKKSKKPAEHKQNFQFTKEDFHKNAFASPNGYIRKNLNGNILRKAIEFTNLAPNIPQWQNNKLAVKSLSKSGVADGFNLMVEDATTLEVVFTPHHDDAIAKGGNKDGNKGGGNKGGNKGGAKTIHTRELAANSPILFASLNKQQIQKEAREVFSQAVDGKQPIFISLKDTVIKNYDGKVKNIIEEIFNQEYRKKCVDVGLESEFCKIYSLVDAGAAKMIARPPDSALWFVPEYVTANKLRNLIELLQQHGLHPDAKSAVISRMCDGGEGFYGSFNHFEDRAGEYKILLGGKPVFTKKLEAGDSVILLTSDERAIRNFALSSLRNAKDMGLKTYFCLDSNIEYENQFIKIIHDLAAEHQFNNYEICQPDVINRKLFIEGHCALYGFLNLDGDIYSDIVAEIGGSLAVSESVIEGCNASNERVSLYEAPHGTAPDLYDLYQKSGNKTANFNSSALIASFANALLDLSEISSNKDLANFANRLHKALIKTVADGFITPDLSGKMIDGTKNETKLNMEEFIRKVSDNIA